MRHRLRSSFHFSWATEVSYSRSLPPYSIRSITAGSCSSSTGPRPSSCLSISAIYLRCRSLPKPPSSSVFPKYISVSARMKLSSVNGYEFGGCRWFDCVAIVLTPECKNLPLPYFGVSFLGKRRAFEDEIDEETAVSQPRLCFHFRNFLSGLNPPRLTAKLSGGLHSVEVKFL